VVRAARAAEAGGFDTVWTLDSPPLAGRLLDPYVALTLCAQATAQARLGVAVTNPVTRHPAATAAAALSLDEVSEGRLLLGIASGDSAMRTLGLAGADEAGTHATRRDTLREAVHVLRTIFRGEAVVFRGKEFRVGEPRPRIPIYIAATGPKMLELAGEIADGAIIQVGIYRPCVEWALGEIRKGAERAGRDFRQIDIVCSRFTAVGDDKRLAIDRARPLTAWFYGVAPDLLKMAAIEVTQRTPLHSVYPDISHPLGHDAAMVEAKKYVANEAVEKFCLVGPPADCVARIRELADLGVHEIFLRHYLTYTIPHDLIGALSRSVLPAFR
jgi:5,10-methylenetetrahydromethanopterin reductase